MVPDSENIFELLKNIPTAVCVLMIVPVILLSTSEVSASNEFPVFRMQQYDLNGVKYGSRGASINLEARSMMSENLIRRCAVVRAADIIDISHVKKAIDDGLSALLILLPVDLDQANIDVLKQVKQLESELLETDDLPIPVYFSHETEQLNNLYESITSSVNGDAASSALKAMTAVASSNSFHFVTDAGESKAMSDFSIVSIQGKLTGQGLEDQLPTIAIVTHYDSFSAVPKLSLGADSTASGVVALLELARLFSVLYNNAATRPKYNLLFLLAGGGKFNYQGTKKWIEENIESSEISLLAEADYVLCIDAIGQGGQLNLHVSKPPKEGSQAYLLTQEFKKAMNELYGASMFNIVHKKVNLADDLLAWEHERFSMRRLPAGTFSHHTSPPRRGSITDTKADFSALERNIRVIAEGLSRHIFNISTKAYTNKLEIFSGSLGLDSEFMASWLEHLSQQPRSQQLIGKDSRLLAAMEDTLSQYLREVKRVVARSDKKDSEFVFYDVFEAKMNVHSVKPALFDLILAFGIATYLFGVYLVVENFSMLTMVLPGLQNRKKVQ